MQFVESNMLLSCDEQVTYRIEKSNIVRQRKDIKACEFFALIGGRMVLLEAKSSSPRPNNKIDFDKYIADISQKFVDTLLLFNAISIGRYGEAEINQLPDKIHNVSLGDVDYAMYLVVHGNELEWMLHIQDALKMQLKHHLTLWNIPDANVYAINHETAKAKGLIKEYIPLDVMQSFKQNGLKDNDLQQAIEQWFNDNTNSEE